MQKTIVLLSLGFILLLTACVAPATPAKTDTPAPVTPSPLPPTWTPTPRSTATVMPTATPFQPFEAKAITDYLNVRANPGMLFGILTQLPMDTSFRVLGRSPGSEWVYVELEDGQTGWIFAQLVAADMDLQLAPVHEPQDVQRIRGVVRDGSGQPVSGIQFMVQSAAFSAQSTSAVTDAEGYFYAFLPADATGKWYVSYTAMTCSSNKMDADCNCLGGVCGSVSPVVDYVTLPQAEPMEFLWE